MTGLVRAGCYCIGVTRSVGIPDPRPPILGIAGDSLVVLGVHIAARRPKTGESTGIAIPIVSISDAAR